MNYNGYMQQSTLCFLIRKDEICLAMKKRGFGKGKWNGVGGKVRKGETIEQAAAREMKEEIGITVDPQDLERVGNIKFYFNKHPNWDQHMHIFLVRKWEGQPKETEEMKPKWYPLHRLPLEKMWVDDPYWLPRVIEGRRITAEFHFANKGDTIREFEVKELWT